MFNRTGAGQGSRAIKTTLMAAGLSAGLSFSTVAMAGSWQNGVSIGGFNNVNIYTPDTTSSIGDGKALLIVLHGCAQPINNYSTANLEDAAENYGMVVAVPDAMNKAGFSCWSYWQGTRNRSSGDYANLINLANTMSGDAARNIDSDQVYIAGLSSGAAFANTTACIAPDVFAGMGISAGPSIGTSSNGALGPCESADVRSRCLSYAGSYASHFDTQIASIAFGDQDTTVNTCYNDQNADGMAAVYGVNKLPGTNVITEDGRTADETLWEDGRVSKLWLNGVDHAWSGGQGASGGYISGAGINYANYLGAYFRDNNKRVNRNVAPDISNVQLSSNGSTITVTANVVDTDGTVQSAIVAIEQAGQLIESLPATVNAQGDFTVSSSSLADGLFDVSVTATDDQGAASTSATETVRVGPEPPPTAPVLANVAVSTNGQCATVTGDVTDENLNVDTVTVAFSTETVTASMSSNAFSATACNLPGGSNSATVTATDTGGLTDTQTVSFDIDAGQVATLDQHITAGRLDYGNYANCYLEYSTAAFKLNEVASGSQCVWQDDDASCVGPLQACAGSTNPAPDPDPDPDPDPSPECVSESTFNYYHKLAGRAYSSGNVLAPDYFATGSDEALPGSTWGSNTLFSVDGSVWSLGDCP